MAMNVSTHDKILKVVTFKFEIETPEDIPTFNSDDIPLQLDAAFSASDVITPDDEGLDIPLIDWDEDTNILCIHHYSAHLGGNSIRKLSLTREQFPLTITFRSDDFGAISVDHG